MARMVEVFREVRRVLRDDGSLWLNLGDSYSPDHAQKRSATWKGVGESGNSGLHSKTTGSRARDTRGTVRGLKPKDLVGVPWRVAFALQQPWERRAIKDATDRAWMAGLVDGEGCVSVVAVQPTTGVNESHSMRVQIRMADAEAVERVVAFTGMSNVTYDLDTGEGNRPAQQWKISGDKAADVLADIYPWLTVKRRQAIVGWNLQRLKDGIVTKRGQPIPQANMEKRRLLHDVLRKLNQREPVDIPSWCREPFVETEPGWYLRSDVIWSKPNPMPESVTDRPTKSHEYVFLLTKSARYWFDQEAVREPHESTRWGGRYHTQNPDGKYTADSDIRIAAASKARVDRPAFDHYPNGGRNVRSVWEIATQPYAEAHFATYPQELVRRCLLAGCPEWVCGTCGKPRERLVTSERLVPSGLRSQHKQRRIGKTDGNLGANGPTVATGTTGWSDCGHDNYQPGVVLDPFMGSGTTALVARNHGRRSIGIELNADYCQLAARRLSQQSLLAGDAA